MIKYCKNVILILGLASIQIISAQTTTQKILSGIVKDSIGLPIESVVVIIEKEENGNIIAFGQTDTKGRYSVAYKTSMDSILLKFRKIGLKTIIKVISTNEEELNITMVMSSENYLKEVVIKNRKPIESYGDTIYYNPRNFKDGTEKNVEELLAKLPGISVDASSGIIKYQGQEIDKILLDGDDLTGNNYKVLSKNLSADWLDGVEIVKKFNDKRLLRGIAQSDKIAINLKLNESAKAPLFGELEAGEGIQSKYSLKTELLSYLKKLKLFSIIETNNTGFDLETYDLETYESIEHGSKGLLFAEEIQNNNLVPPDFFKKEYFTFHHGVFVSNAMLLSPLKNLKVRSVTNFYDNHLNYNFSDSLSYFLPNELQLSINQIQNQIQKPQEIFQDLKADYQLADTQDLSANFKIKSNHVNLISNNETPFRDVEQFDNKKLDRILGFITYTNKLNNKWVLESEFKLASEVLEEELKIVDKNDISNNLNQNIKQKYKNISGGINFYGKIKEGVFLNSSTGWLKSKSEFNSSFNMKYNFENLYSEIEFKSILKKFAFNASVRIRLSNIEFNDNKSNQILFEPLIAISYENLIFKVLNLKVKSMFSIENQFLKPSQLFTQTVITNFRSRISYDADFSLPQQSKLLFFNVKATDNENSFITGNIGLGFERLENGFIQNISFDDDIVTTQYVQSAVVESVFTNANIDKYFTALKSNIGFSYDNSLSKSLLSLNGELGNSRLRQEQYKTDAGIILSKKLNVSTSIGYNKILNKWFGNTTTVQYMKYFAKLVYKQSPKFRVSGDTQILDFKKSVGGLSTISSMNLIVVPKNEKWSLAFNLQNIFNQKTVRISQSEPSFFSQTNYPIQNRFFLLTIKYKF